jgi:hypothetical protein
MTPSFYGHEHPECPRCGHHSVVQMGENKYGCLNCNWYRDLSNGSAPEFFFFLFLAGIFLFLMFGIF